MAPSLATDLNHVVTRWDVRQSKRAGYNPYALGLYLSRTDDVVGMVQDGARIRTAVTGCFNDRLRDYILTELDKLGHDTY